MAKTQITAQPDRVVAGRVSFDAENQSSKELVHEIPLLKQPASGGPLPYDGKAGRVIEPKAVKLIDTDHVNRFMYYRAPHPWQQRRRGAGELLLGRRRGALGVAG